MPRGRTRTRARESKDRSTYDGSAPIGHHSAERSRRESIPLTLSQDLSERKKEGQNRPTMRDNDNVEAGGEGVFPMTWDVDGGGICGDRITGITSAAEEEANLSSLSLHRLSRSMPNLAELRQLRDRIFEVRFHKDSVSLVPRQFHPGRSPVRAVMSVGPAASSFFSRTSVLFCPFLRRQALSFARVSLW